MLVQVLAMAPILALALVPLSELLTLRMTWRRVSSQCASSLVGQGRVLTPSYDTPLAMVGGIVGVVGMAYKVEAIVLAMVMMVVMALTTLLP